MREGETVEEGITGTKHEKTPRAEARMGRVTCTLSRARGKRRHCNARGVFTGRWTVIFSRKTEDWLAAHLKESTWPEPQDARDLKGGRRLLAVITSHVLGYNRKTKIS